MLEQEGEPSGGAPPEDGGDLSGVLRRLTDPRKGTRRTPAARVRLANDDITRELLDAGLRLLSAEFGADRPRGAVPNTRATTGSTPRFFDFLSVARVTAEATRRSRSAITAAQMRDRWPRRAGYVDDLLAYALSRHEWVRHLERSAAAVAGLGRGADLQTVVRDVAARNVFPADLAVTYRLSLVAATLAPSRPEVRTILTASYDQLDAAWSALYAQLAAGLGLRLRDGVVARDLTRALTALAEGMNLRLAALGDDLSADGSSGSAMLAAGALALARQCLEPDPGPGAPPTARGSWDGAPLPVPAVPPAADLSEVLLHLTDPVTGSRRTPRARDQLANDPTTRVLLEAGLGLLDDEFRGWGSTAAGARPEPSHFFDFLSASRVSAEVTTARRLMATPAHLRDRWPHHDDFVDDLVSYAVSSQQGTFTPAASRRAARLLAVGPDLQAVAREVTYRTLVTFERMPSAGLRLVAATLAEGRPAVRAAMRETYERQEEAWAVFHPRLLARYGRRLRDDVPLPLLTRLVMAMTDGMVVRLLALGEQGLLDRPSHDSLFGRASVLLLLGCSEPVDRPGG